MAVRFRWRDPLGREVVLHDGTWDEHILPDHAELAGQEAAVEATIRRPGRINEDADRSDRVCFYRRRVLPAPYDVDFLKVVVELRGPDRSGAVHGRVVTAYATPTVKAGEQQVWPKRSAPPHSANSRS